MARRNAGKNQRICFDPNLLFRLDQFIGHIESSIFVASNLPDHVNSACAGKEVSQKAEFWQRDAKTPRIFDELKSFKIIEK